MTTRRAVLKGTAGLALGGFGLGGYALPTRFGHTHCGWEPRFGVAPEINLIELGDA